MAVFLMILKIIGWIILSVLAIVVLALFVRIRIVADYGEDTSVRVRWLFLNIPVFPMKKKDKKQKDAAPAEEPPAEELPPEELPPEETSQTKADQSGKPNILSIFYESNGGVDGLILLIKEVFSYIGSFFGGIFHAFVVDELMVDMTVTKSDAAQTAIYYGQLCSTVFPMLGAFVTKYKVRQYDFNIEPDFLAKKSSAAMHISFWFRPAKLIGVVLLLVGRLVFKVGFKVAFRMLRPLLSAKKGKDVDNNSIEKSGASNE